MGGQGNDRAESGQAAGQDHGVDRREPPGLDAGLLFGLFLSKYTRTQMCTYEEKGHLPVENTEGGTKLKMEMTSPS